jgi:pyruvate/2-oxoglutarate dehydrogenase complex dihydrolipoamide acyltransferase (E2) component
MFDILKALFGSKPAPHKVVRFPLMRNYIIDMMSEGRRKNTVHMLFEADATFIFDQLQRINGELVTKITLTSYIAKVLADTVAANPHMHAYRHGQKKLVLFDNVDLSVIVERKIEEDVRMPVHYVVHSANQKTLGNIDHELKAAKTTPLYGNDRPLTNLEAHFLSWPRLIRRFFWFFIRRDPHVFRIVAGTVGITSLPAQTAHPMNWTPITPTTLTLVIGAVSPVVNIVNGLAVERQTIHLNLAFDHDVIDGAQVMRFIKIFRKRLYGEIAQTSAD